MGHITRHSEHDPYLFGFEVVLLIASWDRVRVPVALGLIDPQCRGHQNILFRQMLEAFVPPAWVRQVVVIADAGFAANETLRLITKKRYRYVFAIAMCLPCPGRGNLPMVNICAIWSTICPSPATLAGPATNPMAAGRITGSLLVTQRSISWVMSR